jgi:hypothetical protein
MVPEGEEKMITARSVTTLGRIHKAYLNPTQIVPQEIEGEYLKLRGGSKEVITDNLKESGIIK